MTVEKKVGSTVIRLVKGDITDMEVEAFVFYASPDLKLGTGYGGAISVRGGPSVQEELDRIGRASVGEAVLTGAGKMKARHIIHAVGPRFQEEDEEDKLRRTIAAVLKVAEQNGLQQVAFPPMGSGFYGIPLPVSCRALVETLKESLQGSTSLRDVLLVALDSREYHPFKASLEAMG